MAISPQSFDALTTLKSNNALDSLTRYIDLLLDPSIGNDEETSYTPYSEADQYLKMRDLIKDGSGEFNSNSEKNSVASIKLTGLFEQVNRIKKLML